MLCCLWLYPLSYDEPTTNYGLNYFFPSVILSQSNTRESMFEFETTTEWIEIQNVNLSEFFVTKTKCARVRAGGTCGWWNLNEIGTLRSCIIVVRCRRVHSGTYGINFNVDVEVTTGGWAGGRVRDESVLVGEVRPKSLRRVDYDHKFQFA